MKINNLQLHYLDKFILLHDDKYDYSKSEIISSNKKITVVCKTHGDFLVTPNNHINKKSGCPKCKNINLNFIKECKIIHNYKYDYSKTNYINNKTIIIITCNTHGDFEQLPFNHKNGFGCIECSNEIKRLDVEKFLNEYEDTTYDY